MSVRIWRVLRNRVGELNVGVQNSITLLGQNFAKHMNELSQMSGEGTGALKAYMSELNEALKQNLNQVFTSVSNGKTGSGIRIAHKRGFCR